MRYYITEPGYVISAAILLSILDIIAVALRFWARTKYREAIKADDWLMLPATILVTAIGISVTYGVAKGAIAHPTEIPPDFNGNPLEITTPQISLIYKIQWAFDLMLPLAFGCIKCSFLLFYRRIFVVNERSGTNYLITCLIVIVALSSAGFFFASLFQCRLDFSALWGSTIEIIENCVDTMHLVLSVCITGFILDIIIITTPVPLVWQLNLSRTKKISVVGVFLLGSVSIVASLLRLINLARLVSQGFSADVDGLLVVTQYLYWGLVESAVGIVAACLPTLQFLIRRHSWEPTLRVTRSIFSFKSRSGYAMENSGQSHEEIEVAPLSHSDTNPKKSNSTTKLSFGGTPYSMGTQEERAQYDVPRRSAQP
ncbi:plasma membrane protein Pth11-like protein [Xylaria flabelliformis]|nr:plasma membrane protein Pth11-like protein [Xylaria flabelliformis]